MQRVPQSEFSKYLGAAASPATISRLLRGEVAPNERDLQGFAAVLDIPLETLGALRILDSIPDGRMLATPGLLGYMLVGSKTLLLSGLTMGLGVGQLRAARPTQPTTILVDIVSPDRLPEIEKRWTSWESGDTLAAWLSVGRTLAGIAANKPDLTVRLWARDSEFVDADHEPPTGEIVANDWFALESPPPYSAAPFFKVRFYGDSRWSSFIEPLKRDLAEKETGSRRRLLWDSSNAATDAGFIEQLGTACDKVSRLGVRKGLV